jgi:hypothetical protein
MAGLTDGLQLLFPVCCLLRCFCFCCALCGGAAAPWACLGLGKRVHVNLGMLWPCRQAEGVPATSCTAHAPPPG